MPGFHKLLIGGISEPGRLDAADEAQVEEVLARLLEVAHESWPHFEVSDADFLAHVGGRVPDGGDVVAYLDSIRAADLYLAYACIAGNDAAMRAFVDKFDQMVDVALARFVRQGLVVDDAKQKVLERLVMKRGDRPPALAMYRGQGSLGGYVRMAAVRKLLDMMDKERRKPVAGSEKGMDVLMDQQGVDPELRMLKARYQDEFKAAFQETFNALSGQDSNTLSYYYVSGLNTRQIAALSGVDHTTISRRLVKIRTELMVGTRDRLRAAIGVDTCDFDSVVRLVESQLNVSLLRMLGPEAGEQPD